MTATVPDVETIDHLDFTPACGNPSGCTNVARYVIRHACGCAVPICDECAARVKIFWTAVLTLTCLLCGRRWDNARLCDVATLEPLR